MRLFKRGTIYWFELVFNGERIQKSTKTKNQRAAGQIASAFHASLAKGEVGITERKPAPTLSAAVKDFLAWSTAEHKAHPRTTLRYRTSSRAVLKAFTDVPLDRITADDVERFKVTRSAEKGARTKRRIRPATVNRELAFLKAVFHHAIKSDRVARNPVSKVAFLNEENQQDRVLTYDEQRRYLAKATPLLRDVATLILETGARPEEIYTIEAKNVSLAGRYLVIPKGKTQAAKRRLGLTSAALTILAKRLESRPTGFVFPCETDEHRPIPKVNNAHDRAVRDSGVAKFRLYDCRHTWATRAAEAGVDLVTLAALLGHSKLAMVTRYAHPTQSHQLSAMEKVEAHNAEREAREFGTATVQ